MSAPSSDVDRPAVCRWVPTAAGVPRLVARGELDLDVREEFSRELYACAPGSVPKVEVDLTAVTFMDAGTGEILAGYSAAAADHGGEVRLTGAGGIVLYVLRTLGLSSLLDGEPAGEVTAVRTAPQRRPPARDLFATSQLLVNASRDLVAGARALCATSASLRRHGRSTG